MAEVRGVEPPEPKPYALAKRSLTIRITSKILIANVSFDTRITNLTAAIFAAKDVIYHDHVRTASLAFPIFFFRSYDVYHVIILCEWSGLEESNLCLHVRSVWSYPLNEIRIMLEIFDQCYPIGVRRRSIRIESNHRCRISCLFVSIRPIHILSI